jgi:hypothetical protein
MTSKEAALVMLFIKHTVFLLYRFSAEGLCAKCGLNCVEDTMKIVSKVINFIASRALNKRQFELLLKEIDSVYMVYLFTSVFVGLVVGVFDSFIECLNSIKLFMEGAQ